MSLSRLLRALSVVCLSVFFVLSLSTTLVAAGEINLNTASVEQLEGLPHVGPVIAKRIVEYREQHPFTSVEQIKEVKGIGSKTFEELQDEVMVE